MNANAIGGFVNMELREAPSGFHGDLMYQSGYTDKDKAYGNYRVVASASNRFLDDNLGVYILGNAEQYDRNADNMQGAYTIYNDTVNARTGYRDVQVSSVTLDRHIETRKRFGGNLIMDYALPSGSIKLVNMFSRLNSISQDYKENIDYFNSHS